MPPDVSSRSSRELHSGGLSTVFQASTDYAHRTAAPAADAATLPRPSSITSSLDRLDAMSHSAGIGSERPVARTGTLRVEQTAAYSPSYLYQLFPTDGSPDSANRFRRTPSTKSQRPIRTRTRPTWRWRSDPRAGRGDGFRRLQPHRLLGASDRRVRDLEVYERRRRGLARLASKRKCFRSGTFRTGEFGFGGADEGASGRRSALSISPALSRTRRATFRLDVIAVQDTSPESVSDDASPRRPTRG